MSISSVDLKTTGDQVFPAVFKLNLTSPQVDLQKKTSSSKKLSLEITLSSEKQKSNNIAVWCPYRQLLAVTNWRNHTSVYQEPLLFLCWKLSQQLNAK